GFIKLNRITGDLDSETNETIQVTITTPTPGVTVGRAVGTLTLTNDDTVTSNLLYATGANGNGQLGVGDTTDRHTPTQVGTATNWATVAAGLWHTVAIRTV
ncbi:MAG: RCC1 domain-containing protein, partial [Acidimicrobiales bacterium]|nr:RCC1 domain-containing protein [Acidimicrobiales bacterium]